MVKIPSELEIRRQFAVRLRAARESAGFADAASAASAIGVSANRYRIWERGEHFPRALELVTISHVLKVELNDLFPKAHRKNSV